MHHLQFRSVAKTTSFITHMEDIFCIWPHTASESGFHKSAQSTTSCKNTGWRQVLCQRTWNLSRQSHWWALAAKPASRLAAQSQITWSKLLKARWTLGLNFQNEDSTTSLTKQLQSSIFTVQIFLQMFKNNYLYFKTISKILRPVLRTLIQEKGNKLQNKIKQEQKVTKMLRDMEHMLFERLGKLGLFSLKKRQLQKHLITA